MSDRHNSPILVLVGPTASGKSSLALEIARRWGGEIINADSRQIYRGLDIGTGKPSLKDRQEIPHHLYDVREVSEPWNAALFVHAADEAIASIRERKRLPIVVGGTGLHIRTFLYGLFAGPGRSPAVRSQLEERIKNEGLKTLYQELTRLDPAAAIKIQAGDTVRIVRALEVFQLTGRPISIWQQEHGFAKPRYSFFKIGIQLDRDELYARINARVREMITQGLEAEAKTAFEKWAPAFTLTRIIGYKEWLAYWEGQVSKETVIENIAQNTRRYAKRQLTWFRAEKDIHWFPVEEIPKSVEEFCGLPTSK